MNMGAQPTASELYAEYRRDASPKFALALDRIKSACDHIQTASGSMTYSQVGKMAVQLFGGPKAQSILNNEKHKAYIDARRREFLQSSSRPSTTQRDKVLDVYPTDGLDYKTRRYIDDLRQRNSMLEAAMVELKKQVLTATEDRPLDLEKMLKAGPDSGLAMTMIPSSSPSIPREAIEAIYALTVDLPTKVAEVELYKGKALRLRTGEWLVTPAQYAALVALTSKAEEPN